MRPIDPKLAMRFNRLDYEDEPKAKWPGRLERALEVTVVGIFLSLIGPLVLYVLGSSLTSVIGIVLVFLYSTKRVSYVKLYTIIGILSIFCMILTRFKETGLS